MRNDGKRPLLRGPATIFGDGEFVGMGELKTTGPSGDIELPLGADQDIRFTRQVVPSSKTTGLTMMNPAAASIAGGSQPHNNQMPYLGLNYCIALQGVFPARN